LRIRLQVVHYSWQCQVGSSIAVGPDVNKKC